MKTPLRMIIFILMILLTVVACAGANDTQSEEHELYEPPAPEETPEPIITEPLIELTSRPAITTFDLPAVDFANAMGVGWNLGNSLDAFTNHLAHETSWNNPQITPELFHAIREAGFTNVRIPVTWIGHIDEDNNVSKARLNRIQEVVNYALDADLYVIINIHHDGNNYFPGGAWLSVEEYPDNLHPNWNYADFNFRPNQMEIRARFEAVWRQIAEHFKDYDARLLFEGFNELRELWNYSNPVNPSSIENLNILNQIFIDTVRATGGNNTYRYLIVAGYNTNARITADANSGFVIPEDTISYRLMLSIHFYDPWYFSLNTHNHDIFKWGQEIRDIRAPHVDNWGNEPHVRDTFQLLYDNFVAHGIPILLGEYGVHDKSDIDIINHEYRRYWLEYVTRAMIETSGFVPIYWDNGNGRPHGGERFLLFDRTNAAPVYSDLIFALVRAPYAPARPLFSRQVIEDTFARYTYDPEIQALFDTAIEAADAFRNDISLETLEAVETAYRALRMAAIIAQNS